MIESCPDLIISIITMKLVKNGIDATGKITVCGLKPVIRRTTHARNANVSYQKIPRKPHNYAVFVEPLSS